MTCPACGVTAPDGARFCRSCGTALRPVPPADPDSTAAAPVDTPRFSTPWRAWRFWLPASRRERLVLGGSVGGVLALLIGGYIVAVSVADARYPPERPIRELFAALAARDTAQAARLAGCTTSPACRVGVLSRGYDPPSDVRLGAVQYGDPTDDTRRPNKAVAYVPVTYRLGADERNSTLRVQRSGSGLVRPWVILTGATGPLDVVTSHVDRVQLGGAEVPVDARTGSDMAALPGTYTVQVAAGDPLFAPKGGPARVVIAAALDASSPATARLNLQIRSEVVDQVTEQVRAKITLCAEQSNLDPPGCPWGISRIVIGAADVRWTVDQQPTITVVPTDDPGPGEAPAEVRTTTAGRVSVTYSAFTSAGGDRDTITEQAPIEVDGEVRIDFNDPDRVIWDG